MQYKVMYCSGRCNEFVGIDGARVETIPHKFTSHAWFCVAPFSPFVGVTLPWPFVQFCKPYFMDPFFGFSVSPYGLYRVPLHYRSGRPASGGLYSRRTLTSLDIELTFFWIIWSFKKTGYC